jgi:hypothetical protein
VLIVVCLVLTIPPIIVLPLPLVRVIAEHTAYQLVAPKEIDAINIAV